VPDLRQIRHSKGEGAALCDGLVWLTNGRVRDGRHICFRSKALDILRPNPGEPRQQLLRGSNQRSPLGMRNERLRLNKGRGAQRAEEPFWAFALGMAAYSLLLLIV
jgi:hypothetical protein